MKYELTDESKIWCGVKLFRIRALKAIPEINVKVGDLGGWIESEKNLSQDGNCWIFSEAKVFENAIVFENAYVYGDAIVFENAKVYGDAYVFGDAKVFGNAYVYGYAVVYGDAKVFGNAYVYGYAKVFGNAYVYGYAKVFGDVVVKHNFSSGVCVSISTTPWNISYSGFDEKGVHYVSVGCQCHSIENWLDEKYRNKIIQKTNFPKEKVEEFLSHLNSISIFTKSIQIKKPTNRCPVTGRFLKKV